jgi:long-chain fatty acid transport protein
MQRDLSTQLYALALLSAALPSTAAATDGPALTGLFATADDAGTAATNPAGLPRLHDSEWVGGIRLSFSPRTSRPRPKVSADLRLIPIAAPSLSPRSITSGQSTKDLSLGISLTIPSGLGSNPGDATPARYLLEKWTRGYVSLTPAAEYRVSEPLSFGVGLNFNYSLYDYQTAVFNGPGQPEREMELRGIR